MWFSDSSRPSKSELFSRYSPDLKSFPKRFKALYRDDLDVLREQKLMIDMLYEKRNKLVHDSIDTIDYYD
ncbi:MAG: hypothetical protein ACFFAS_02915 [Promethearchaeota archaeon]